MNTRELKDILVSKLESVTPPCHIPTKDSERAQLLGGIRSVVAQILLDRPDGLIAEDSRLAEQVVRELKNSLKSVINDACKHLTTEQLQRMHAQANHIVDETIGQFRNHQTLVAA